MKIFLKKHLLETLIAITFFIFLYEIELFRKTYNILTNSYEKRIEKIYGFCSEKSSGFINYIQKKYKLEKNPKIVKFTGVRNPRWIFFNRTNIDDKHTILIKYNNDDIIYLSKEEENNFKYNFSYRNNHKKFLKLLFETKNINLFEKIEIYKNKKIIYEKLIDEDVVNKNNDLVEVIFSKELSDEFYKNNFNTADYYFKFIQKNNLADLKILNVRLKLENEINLNNYKIIEQIENCYFLENK